MRKLADFLANTVARQVKAEEAIHNGDRRRDSRCGQPRAGIERATEVHELGLFTPEEMRDRFRQADLWVTFDPEGLSGRGLYVAHAA